MNLSELQIRNEIQETGSPWQASLNLIEAYEQNPKYFTEEHIESLAHFLWHCGFYKTLVDFVIKHLQKEDFKVPWTYFLEALSHTSTSLDPLIFDYLKRSIQIQNATLAAGKALSFKKYLPEIETWNSNRIQKLKSNYVQQKIDLLQEAFHLREQQLFESEKEILHKAIGLFPGDPDILNEIKEYNERHALELLHKKARQKSDLKIFTDSEKKIKSQQPQELQKGLLSAAFSDPEIAYDLAVTAIFTEQWFLAEEILKLAPDTSAKTWLQLEILLKQNKFLELLALCPALRRTFAQDPDSPFALNYIESQALWGLGQKEKAQILMENLLEIRPHYRFGESLLFLWRTES